METRISLKNICLILVIAIGLIGLGAGSTFAIFNIGTNIDNPITFNSNLNSTGLLAETIEVMIPAGEDKSVDLEISNTSSNNLNYAVWYTPIYNDLVVGSETSNNSYGPVGMLPMSNNFTLTVGFRNSGTDPITVTLGVSSSTDSVVTPNGVTVIPTTQLS